jgi:hypothetical protein
MGVFAVFSGRESPARDAIRSIRSFAENILLIWASIHTNMGDHIVKTTIEIADDLFERVQSVARREKTTFRSLTEQGLRIVLREKQARPAKWKWKPVTFKGNGLTDEFKHASWGKIRDEIYRGHGA